MLSSTPTDGSPADADAGSAHPRRGPGRPPIHGAAAQLEPATPDTILRVARELFMQRGYAGVSVGEVAAAAGVTKPTLYYHFGDKEGLYAAVIRALLEEVGGYISEIAHRTEPASARLVQIARGYFLHADYTMEPMLRDVAQLVSPERAADLRAVYERECFAPIEYLMADGIARHELRSSLDSHLLARAFLALLEAFTASGGHTTRTPAEHAAVARSVVALFWGGACGEGRASEVLSS